MWCTSEEGGVVHRWGGWCGVSVRRMVCCISEEGGVVHQ